MASTSVQVPEYVRAIESFSAAGEPLPFKRGEVVHAKHPVVLANPQFFAPLDMAVRFAAVEQATAEPGQRRQTGRRSHRATQPQEEPNV